MLKFPLPKTPSQVIQQLQDTINIANTALEADKSGDLQKALQNYAQVIRILLDILLYYYKTPNSNTEQMEALENKRDKFIKRVNALWQILNSQQKYDYGLVEKPVVPKEREMKKGVFTDLQTSFLNIVNLNQNLEQFEPYSSGDLGTLEKIDRLSTSIKYGAFIKPNLFVPSDVWLLPISRLDNLEAKQNAFQAISVKLDQLMKCDAVQTKAFIQDSLLPEFELYKPLLLGKKQKIIQNDSWGIKFFKPKQTSYILTLLSFLDKTIVVTNLVKSQSRQDSYNNGNGTTSNGTKQSEVYRNLLARVVEFYEYVVLPLVYRDMEILVQRFIKKIRKRLVVE